LGFHDLISERRAVIIGGSGAIVGTGVGSLIDSYDVVVRVNCHWPCPLEIQPPIDAKKDIGYRTDVLFACLGNLEMKRLRRMKELKLIILTDFKTEHLPPENTMDLAKVKRLNLLMAHCKKRNIPYYWYGEKHLQILSDATSGILALSTLMSEEPSELFVAGFDFYTFADPQKAWLSHKPAKEREYFRKHIASDERVILHEHVEESLKSDVQVIQVEDDIKL
jgi:hypothetical protein